MGNTWQCVLSRGDPRCAGPWLGSAGQCAGAGWKRGPGVLAAWRRVGWTFVQSGRPGRASLAPCPAFWPASAH